MARQESASCSELAAVSPAYDQLIARTDPDTGSASMRQFPAKNIELNTCFSVFSVCIKGNWLCVL